MQFDADIDTHIHKYKHYLLLKTVETISLGINLTVIYNELNYKVRRFKSAADAIHFSLFILTRVTHSPSIE